MDSHEADLKRTVNLPKTAFPMKANLPQTEPKLLERWETAGLYHRIRASRAGRPLYVLHDGPPYANGRIHLGTAFNKILKDFIVKSKTMAGFDSPYVPGWDCHGLPIEIKVDSDLGAKKAQMSAVEIRRACRKYAEKYIDLQRKDFKRLGVLGRWEDPYLTMSAHYQSVIAGAFVDFLDRGYVYKGLKPVHWCIHDRTALAEAEVEYHDHTSPSIWVRFALISDPAAIHPDLAGRNVYGLIWTTTPWTLPANMAIAFHPKYEYVAVEVSGADDRLSSSANPESSLGRPQNTMVRPTDVYFVATELVQVTAEKCGWQDYHVLAAVPGSKLEHAVFHHPFLERESLGMLADHVTLDQGTGAVHTAPGHGQEDYAIGRHYGIETYCPVDASGRFYHASGAPGRLPDAIIGKTIWEANPIVLEILRAHGALLGTEKLAHSYPHCWRCHHPVIFRATEQWFIGMERNDLRGHALDAIKQVRWMPSWGEERISNMIATRPDWCISRQRIWGVPIIVFYCEACREPLTDREILDGIVDLFRRAHRRHLVRAHRGRAAAARTTCPRCGGAEFRKETDILDVWFDSGSSHLAVLNDRFGLPWPADLYIEGGDQYRGWFHSSLLVGVGLKGGSPYRACALNGWVLDGEGKAMHKSLGNSIEPRGGHQAPRRRNPAPVVGFGGFQRRRAHVGDHPDAPGGRLSQAAQHLPLPARQPFRLRSREPTPCPPRKWRRSTSGFCSAPKTWWPAAAPGTRTSSSTRSTTRSTPSATVDLSAVYFDVLKDRLYTSAAKSKARRGAQTALYRLLDALVRLLAPIMSFTAEEVWTHMGRAESVHLAYFPEPAELSAGLTAGRPETGRQLGPSNGGEGRCSQEPGSGAQREADRRAARSPRPPLRQWRPLPAAQ